MGYTPHVLVLGGGITGTAIARDLAIRGLDVTLVERDGLTSGSTGRMQGLLYSGARYAETDQSIARRSLSENRTLTQIASHCVEDTGGLLVTDGDEAFDSLAAACRECGIPVEELSGEQARSQEPALADIDRALEVPDRVVDPFRLTVATAQSAIDHGATIRTHTEVTDIQTEDGTVERVTVDHDPAPTGRGNEESTEPTDDETAGEQTDESPPVESPDEKDPKPDGGQKRRGGGRDAGSPSVPGMPGTISHESDPEQPPGAEELEPDYVVNATGPWVDRVAGLAGLEFPLRRSRSVMAVTEDQPVDRPVLYHDSEQSLSVVPYGTHCVLGEADRTSSSDGDPDSTEGSPGDVDDLVADVAEVVPAVGEAHVLRSFWGVRSGPPKAGVEGRPFVLFDHADYHDCWGMTSVIGGTLTTHRLVAERVADQVCEKFGISRECRTDEMPLPGSDDPAFLDAVIDQFDLPAGAVQRTRERLGDEAIEVLDTDGPNPLVCERELVSRAEIRHALADESATDLDLDDVRVRTSAGMGRCQGGRCGHRIAAHLHPDHDLGDIEDALDDLLADRWKGQRQSLWGPQLEQAAQNYRFHAATLSRKYRHDDDIDLAEFDDGPDRMDGGPPTARRGMRR